jgi:hypothetical protein
MCYVPQWLLWSFSGRNWPATWFSRFPAEEKRRPGVLVGNSGCPVLQKPFEAEEFWNAIRKILSSQISAAVKG